MGLIHWWPLNGDTKDYGTKNLNGSLIGSTSFDNAGKIGQCLLADNGGYTGHGVDIPSNLVDELSNTDYSFCAWVKVNGNHVHYEGAIISSGNWNNSCWAFGLNQDNTAINPAGSWYATSYVSYTFEVGKWYHIVSVQQNTTNKVYVNGTLIGTVTHGHISQSDASDTCIGRETYAGGYFGFNGCINDVRIYDHALSAKEVKEISKGLVLHYDFNDPYVEGTLNYADQTNVGGWNNVGTATWNNPDTTISNKPCLDSKVISLYKNDDGNSCITFGSSGNTTLRGQVVTASTWVYLTGNQSGEVVYLRSGAHDGAICYMSYNGSSYTSQWPKNQWIHISGTGTVASDESYVYFCTYLDNEGEKRAFNGWQLEQKDHATPYVNGTRPAGTVYDSSGYGYNGTIHGNLQMAKDTACGEYSALFSEDNTWISTDYKTYGLNVLTYSAWVYPTARTNDRSCISIGGTYFTIDGDGYLSGYAYGKNPEGYFGGSTVIPLNAWTHIAIVWDESYMYGYVNGQLDFKVATTGIFNNGKEQDIGKEQGAYRQFYGKIADLKIFATALSASDILAEYNRKASIDSNGNVFTSEFVETTNNILELGNYNIATQSQNSGYLAAYTARKDIYDANYPNPNLSGLGAYTQGNLQVTDTAQGIRIYSEPNRDGRAQEGSEWNTWGGLCISPMMNSNCLVKGHRYVVSFHIKGQSSGAMDSVYWSNQIGWRQYPDAEPTYNKIVVHGADFQGEMDCFIDFTINDDVWKTTGSDVHSGFEPNTTYLAYAALKIGYDYRETGPLGTDIYITNLSMIDVTSGEKYNITKDGIINTPQIITGVNNKAKIHSSGILDVTNIEEC